jgi:MarR family transcriptional regulator, transcriptional regulator for hemolysin
MEERLGRLLAMTGKVVREAFNEDLANVGSSLNAYIILTHADTNPGLSQRQLAAMLGIEGPTLTHHLDRLTAEGLLRRVRHPDDRRAYCVELTPEGAAHLEHVTAYADQFDAGFRKLFTEPELGTLFELLTRIRDHYTKESDVVDHAVG